MTTKKAAATTSKKMTKPKTAIKKKVVVKKSSKATGKAVGKKSGVPAVTATKKTSSSKRKGVEKLGPQDAHIKYRARLSTIPDSEFSMLHQRWISVYEPSLRKKGSYKIGDFPLKWMKVLNEVATEKGATILGVLPHYSRSIDDTDLKAYEAKPECVDWDRVSEYHKMGYEDVIGNRIYVGRKNAMSNVEESKFAFKASDTHSDLFWLEVKKILEGEDSSASEPEESEESGTSEGDEGESDSEEMSD